MRCVTKSRAAGSVISKFRVLALGALGFLLVVFAIGMISAWWMMQPWRYYVQPPTDRAKRDSLVAKIANELAYWRKPDMAVSAADADRQWPLERLPIVLAIEEYYLKKGEAPPSIETLIQAGLLSDPSVAKRFRLVLRNGKWELRKTDAGDYLTAVGN